ncbi:hypothetical protein CDD83_8504 [Cordyceps sp. RAO-2017]|nr:hypothetical protein CDD83_8504 [Cordyceps sp. RAO-2017]
MRDSLTALLGLNLLTVPIFVAQVRGYSKLYDRGDGSVSRWYEAAQYPFFVLFSDTAMYWQHRLFHHPFLFNAMHKKHHRYDLDEGMSGRPLPSATLGNRIADTLSRRHSRHTHSTRWKHGS